MNNTIIKPLGVDREQFYKQINNKVNPLNSCQATAMATCLAYITRDDRTLRIRLAFELDKMLLRFNRLILSKANNQDNSDYFNTVYDQASLFIKNYKLAKKKAKTLVGLVFPKLDDIIYTICLHGDVWKPSPLSVDEFTGYFPIEYASVRDKFLRHLGQKIGTVLHDYRTTYTFNELLDKHVSLDRDIIMLASVKLYGFYHVTAIQLLSNNSIVIYDPYGHPDEVSSRKKGSFNEIISGRTMKRYLNAKNVKCHMIYIHDQRPKVNFKEFRDEK